MTIPCPQCGGAVPLAAETVVAPCPYCASSLYVDLSGALLHHRLRAEIDERQARRLLGFRDPKCKPALVDYPFWMFERAGRVRMVPADSHLVEDFPEQPALSGNLQPFTSTTIAASRAIPPDIPLGAVVSDAERGSSRARLVHVPFYRFAAGDERRLIDAVTGQMQTAPPVALDHAEPPPWGDLLATSGALFLALLVPGAEPKLIATGAVIAAGLPVLLLRARQRGGSP